MIKKLLIFITIFLINFKVCFAYIFYSESATHDLNKRSPEILIIEVNVKNNDSDFIKIKVFENTDLYKYSIWADSKIFTFQNSFKVNSNEEIKIILNQEKEFTNKNIIQTTYKGLTGTNEQLTLLNNNNKIIDAICWENKNPTQSETKDKSTLEELGMWNGPCINSDLIEKNKSIIRQTSNDTNTVKDWKIETTNENTEINEVNTGNGTIQTSTTSPNNTNSNKNTETTENLQKIAKNYSNAVKISEFLPNPKGQDKNQEWIELYNNSPIKIDLTNWKLDDEEGGSKAYTFKNAEIQAYSYLLITNNESKLNLNNTEDSVRLITPNNEIKDEVSYEDSPESHSFISEILDWTTTPTPGKPNIVTIESSEEFLQNNQRIEDEDISNQIFFSEIFPNPEGADKTQEWIELTNKAKNTINLGNWKISNGKKEFILTNDFYIDPNSFLLISDEELGFSLKNSNEILKLITPKEKIQDEIAYKKSEEAKSYSKISETEWIWIEPSPNEENPTLENLEGEIKKINELNKSIEIENAKMEILTISLQDENSSQINELSFKEGNQIKLIAQKNQNNEYKLREIQSIESAKEDKQQQQESNKKSQLLNILVGLIILCSLILITKKYIKKLKIKYTQKHIERKCMQIITNPSK